MNRRALAVGFLLAWALGFRAHGGDADWTRFRGPNGSGQSTADLPAEWGPDNYLWKATLPGGGNSSPVLWGEHLYLTCADPEAGKEMLVCVDASHGSILWTHDYPTHAYPIHSFNSYASSSATTDEKGVYFCWSTPESLSVAALDHTGKERWRRDLGPFVSQHGGGQSPIVYKDKLIVTDDQEGPESFLFALNRDTGATAWKVARGHSDKFSAATPCVFEPRDGEPQIVFASKRHGLTALNPATGEKVWELSDVFDARTVASPFVADGLIIGTCGDGPTGHMLVAARPSDDGASAAFAYQIVRSVPYVPTPIAHRGLLFYLTDNGMLTCAHVNGGDTIWKRRLEGNFFGSPVIAGEKMYCVSKEGDVYVIATAEVFAQLARNHLDLEDSKAAVPPLATTPAIANGKMYVRTFNHLACIGKPAGAGPAN